MYGAVTCVPGAFCMLDPAALQAVFSTYSKEPTGLYQKILVLLGEDRYLTMLLLKAGYQTLCCLQAKAYTKAPETLHAWMVQQRRWVVLTAANEIMMVTSWAMWTKSRRLNIMSLVMLVHVVELLGSLLSHVTYLWLMSQFTANICLVLGIPLSTDFFDLLWVGYIVSVGLISAYYDGETFFKLYLQVTSIALGILSVINVTTGLCATIILHMAKEQSLHLYALLIASMLWVVILIYAFICAVRRDEFALALPAMMCYDFA